jgi:hypothetical protein
MIHAFNYGGLTRPYCLRIGLIYLKDNNKYLLSEWKWCNTFCAIRPVLKLGGLHDGTSG